MSESRARFLQGIRHALGHPPAPHLPELDLSPARLAFEGNDLAGLFEERSTEVGISVQRVAGHELSRAIADLLGRIGARRVALALGSDDLRSVVQRAMRDSDVEHAGDPFDADAGITDVACALAETGTLVLFADRDRPRAASLVPPLHLAIVREGDLVPDMLDFVAATDGAWPSCAVLVTGPSKTADIEGELICGVHGPGEVVAFLVTEK